MIYYKGEKYGVYTLKKGSGFLYFNEKTGDIVSDKDTADKLFKLLAMGKTYSQYKRMMEDVKKLTPGLLYGKEAIKQIGDSAIKAVITRNPGRAFSDFMKKQTEPSTLLTYVKMSWGFYEYQRGILPKMESVYSNTKGIKVTSSKNVIIVNDNKKEVNKVFNNYLEGFYRWKYFLDALDRLGLTVEGGVKGIVKETVDVFKDSISFDSMPDLPPNEEKDVLMFYKELTKAKDLGELVQELRNNILAIDNYYKYYEEAVKEFSNLDYDMYVERVKGLDQHIKYNYSSKQ
ncbi:hypothetical protein HNR63_000217 [Anoxybacillus kamchatkensis]|uniref:hypothetical protein n=1 Tax=Anoxybacillus ayderensis TaxID=265546 RepID=UPI0015EC1FA7|nr:hypothetical protein [Anoxybacillus ayderensis]MBA2877190.1 hypothetical protein [Anoxybacillus ayderensis]